MAIEYDCSSILISYFSGLLPRFPDTCHTPPFSRLHLRFWQTVNGVFTGQVTDASHTSGWCVRSTVENVGPTSELSFVGLSHGCRFWVHGFGCDGCPTLVRSFHVSIGMLLGIRVYIPLQTLDATKFLSHWFLLSFLPQTRSTAGLVLVYGPVPFALSFLKVLFTEGLWPLDFSLSRGNLFKMSHA